MKDAHSVFCIRVDRSQWVAFDQDFRLADTTWLREARFFPARREAQEFINVRLLRQFASHSYQVVQFLFVEVESIDINRG